MKRSTRKKILKRMARNLRAMLRNCIGFEKRLEHYEARLRAKR